MIQLSKRQWLTGAGILAAAVVIGLVYFGRGTEVEVVVARSGPLVQSIVVTGRMATESRVFLGSTLTGRVREVRFREGAAVKAGELIVQLEDSEQLASMHQASAALRTADARLVSQRSLSGPLAIQQSAQARANAEAAERERERGESLFLKGFIGQSRLDELRRLADVARSQLKAAEAQSDANVKGSELEQAVARVAEARAALEFANSRLEQTRLRAPAAGLLLERLVEPGQIVQPGAKLIEMSIGGPQQLIAQVDEKFLSQLKIGQLAGVTADAFPSQRFEARIQTIAPVVDAQRGSIEVKFSMSSPPGYLKNDMTLSLEIETARRDKALALPAEAIRTGNRVWLLEDGRAQPRKVVPGIRTLTAVEIVEGLKDGDVVILDQKIIEGQRVRRGKHVEPANAASSLPADLTKSFGRE